MQVPKQGTSNRGSGAAVQRAKSEERDKEGRDKMGLVNGEQGRGGKGWVKATLESKKGEGEGKEKKGSGNGVFYARNCQ